CGGHSERFLNAFFSSSYSSYGNQSSQNYGQGQGYSGYGQSGDNSSYGQNYGSYHGNYGQNQSGLASLLHSLAGFKR
ncbi:RBP56 factor, partial [Nicator chloris]|nr:RBP56 factor [Nicator chloris]